MQLTRSLQVVDLRSQVEGLKLRVGEERARADREADSSARLRDEIAVVKLQEQQAAAREAGVVERSEKLQGELLVVQGRLQLAEQQFREQQRLLTLQNQQQQQHQQQQQQQHHTEELKSLRMQRDTWETEARHAKSLVSELVATNARLQVSCPRARTRHASELFSILSIVVAHSFAFSLVLLLCTTK